MRLSCCLVGLPNIKAHYCLVTPSFNVHTMFLGVALTRSALLFLFLLLHIHGATTISITNIHRRQFGQICPAKNNFCCEDIEEVGLDDAQIETSSNRWAAWAIFHSLGKVDRSLV